MLRLLIIGALLTAVASAEARERIRPYLSPVLDPTYEWSVRSRVSEIGRRIETEGAAGRRVPGVGSIADFVAHLYRQEEAGLDPWGSEFHLVKGSRGLHVASAGRDRTLHTGDDILSPVIGEGSR
jgi:hypothetical protein